MDSERRSSVTESDPSRQTDSSEVIAEKEELRKNLNAYAIMAYVAVADRNAMAEQLKALDHVSKAMGELKEKLQHEENRSQSLQLEIWRNEAFVTRSRLQLKIRDNQIRSLTEQLDKLKRTSEGTKDQENNEERNDCGKDCKEVELSNTDEKYMEEKSQKTEYLMKGGLQIGVSREIHEAVIQENLQLKKTIQVIENQGASLKDLIDTIQYKEVIKQLKRKVAQKEEELAEMQTTLKDAEGPKEKTAKMLLELKAAVKDCERTIKMKQVMLEALSSRCEELSKALQLSQNQDEYKLAYVRSALSDSSTSQAQVLPPIEIKKLTQEKKTLEKVQQVLKTENDSLRRELEVTQQDKNDIKRKLAAMKAVPFKPCVTCEDYKHQLMALKSDFEAARIQGETYKFDYQEKCEAMEKVKSVLHGELDTWKTNFQTLSRQTENFKKELKQQMDINSQLHAQIRLYSQEIKQQRSDFRSTYRPSHLIPPRCGTNVNPWQESPTYASMPSEVAVGRDECDLASPQHDMDGPSRQQWQAARPTRRVKKLQCVHCQREFSLDRQQEFEDHQKRCLNNS